MLDKVPDRHSRTRMVPRYDQSDAMSDAPWGISSFDEMPVVSAA